jgi:mRNA-degrading endonuclease RelE of RelBE toxin-antitoxin system
MPYKVQVVPKVMKFIQRNPELRRLWEERRPHLLESPRLGQGIRHLREQFHCNYRIRLDVWRLLYEVDDESGVVRLYRARARDNAYDP